MSRNDSHLFESRTDFFAEDGFEGVFFHADNVDRLEFALRDGDHKLHTDERAAYDNEILAFLASCSRFRKLSAKYDAMLLLPTRTFIDCLSLLNASENIHVLQIRTLNGKFLG